MRLKQLFITGLILFSFSAIWKILEHTETPKIEEENESGARKALESWAHQRAYPKDSIPSRGFYEGFVQSVSPLYKSAQQIKPLDNWQTMGPSNYGGRTNALVLDPNNSNILYAGSASGGFWRMTMNGNNYSWEYIDTKFPVLGVNAIAIDPFNSKTLYIGTGEVYSYQNSIGSVYERLTRGSYGIGILKSIDSGLTWQKSLDWSYNQERGVLSLQINPLNPQIIFAGTTEGLFKSTNGGDSWELVHNVLMAVDILINPGDTNVIYVSHGNLGSSGMGIYRSVQGGEVNSFVKLSGGLPNMWTGKTMLGVCKADPDVLYADIANDTNTIGLYYSSNQGDTWTLRTDSNYADYQGWFSHYVRVNPNDCDNLLIAGTHYYQSFDGGQTLKMVGGKWPNNTLHLDHHTYANHPDNLNTVFIGHDGGVSRTTDGGNTFESMNNGYITTQFYPGFSSSTTNPDLAIGGLQDNQVLLYSGAIDDWTLYTTGDGTYTAIDPNNNQVIYAANQRLWITRSDDGGRNWTWLSNDIYGVGTTAFVAPFILSPSQPNILYAGGNFVFKTQNRGQNWAVMNGNSPIGRGNIVAMGISHTDADVLYVTVGPSETSRSEVYRTTNGGISWTNITRTLPDRFYMDVVVSPLDDQLIYLTLSGFGSSHLFWSENGGGSWTDIGSGLPDVPTSAVMVDPDNPDHLYVGNDLGVYASVDHGLSWFLFSEGLPTAVMVMDLSLSPSNSKIRVITHGNGVYERSLLAEGYINIEEDKKFLEDKLWHKETTEGHKFQFLLNQQDYASFVIFDVMGNVIKSWPVKSFDSGESILFWNGRDNDNKQVSNGIYLCRMRVGKFQKSVSFQHNI